MMKMYLPDAPVWMCGFRSFFWPPQPWRWPCWVGGWRFY